MRDITNRARLAFNNGYNFKRDNTKVISENGKTHLYLHGSRIATRDSHGVYITNAGYFTNTTKERLNGLSGVHIVQKNWEWFLNGEHWNGDWVKVG